MLVEPVSEISVRVPCAAGMLFEGRGISGNCPFSLKQGLKCIFGINHRVYCFKPGFKGIPETLPCGMDESDTGSTTSDKADVLRDRSCPDCSISFKER